MSVGDPYYAINNGANWTVNQLTGNWEIGYYQTPYSYPYPYTYLPIPNPLSVQLSLGEAVKAFLEKLESESKSKNKEIDTMFLYRVYLIYAADRKNPQIVATEVTLAKDDEDAKIKSGVYSKIDASWDADYVTIVAEKVAEVKVKPKPQEVKSV